VQVADKNGPAICRLVPLAENSTSQPLPSGIAGPELGAGGTEIIRDDEWTRKRRGSSARARWLRATMYVGGGVFVLVLIMISPARGNPQVYALAALWIGGGVAIILGSEYDVRHAVIHVILNPDGLQLHRRNGSTLRVQWSDEKLNLRVFDFPYQGPSGRVRTLRMGGLDGMFVGAYLTDDGAQLLEAEAERRGLNVTLKLRRFGSVTRIRSKVAVR
jgi:hypothetical protein